MTENYQTRSQRPDIKAIEEFIQGYVFNDSTLEHNVVLLIDYLNNLEVELHDIVATGFYSKSAIRLLNGTGEFSVNQPFVKVRMTTPRKYYWLSKWFR